MDRHGPKGAITRMTFAAQRFEKAVVTRLMAFLASIYPRCPLSQAIGATEGLQQAYSTGTLLVVGNLTSVKIEDRLPGCLAMVPRIPVLLLASNDQMPPEHSQIAASLEPDSCFRRFESSLPPTFRCVQLARSSTCT